MSATNDHLKTANGMPIEMKTKDTEILDWLEKNHINTPLKALRWKGSVLWFIEGVDGTDSASAREAIALAIQADK